MSQWFYRDGEREVGPLKSSELLDLVRDQTIDASTMVRKGQSAWFPAGDVGGLFDAAVKPTVVYQCPECGSEVGKPPCYCRKCRRALDYARPKFIEHEVEGYEREVKEKATLADSWKQWVRRIKTQREQRTGGKEE